MSEDTRKAEETDKVPEPDCHYCGQCGGVSQFDSICEEHDASQATGWVRNGKFYPAKKP